MKGGGGVPGQEAGSSIGGWGLGMLLPHPHAASCCKGFWESSSSGTGYRLPTLTTKPCSLQCPHLPSAPAHCPQIPDPKPQKGWMDREKGAETN